MNEKALLCLLLLGGTPVFGDRVDERQEKQEDRIEAGKASGNLNSKESHRLDRGQAHIESLETKAKSDGNVYGREKFRLEKAQDRQNRRIHRLKNNKR